MDFQQIKVIDSKYFTICSNMYCFFNASALLEMLASNRLSNRNGIVYD